MKSSAPEFRIPIAVADKLETVRTEAWRIRLRTALLGSLGVLLGAMGVVMAVDWWATLFSPAWRSVLTLSALGVSGSTLVLWILSAKRSVSRAASLAAEVDRSLPPLEERWSTITQLSELETNSNVHPAMFRQVAQEASEFTPQVDPQIVVTRKGLRWAGWGLASVALPILGLALCDLQRSTVLFKRFWLPLANISATKVQDVSTAAVVARGESFEIAAQLKGVPVDEATLIIRPADSGEQSITLVPRGERQDRVTHRLRGIKEPLAYRLRAGDGQTAWQEVAVADRPELAMATLTVTPPDYTERDPEKFDKLPRRVSALVGSKLQFAFKPRRDVAKLQLDFSEGKLQSLSAAEDRWYRWETTLAESFKVSPKMQEEHGLTNLRPPLCEVQARPDKPPVVRILTPNQEMVVRPDDKVPVTFEAKDDVRVGSAELVIFDESPTGNREPRILDRIAIPLGDQVGKTDVKATVELDLSKYDVPNGGQLSFAVKVREGRGTAISPSVGGESTLNSSKQSESMANAENLPVEDDPSREAPEASEALASEQAATEGPADKDSEVSPSETADSPVQGLGESTEDKNSDTSAVANSPPSESSQGDIKTPAEPADPSSPIAESLADSLPESLKDIASKASSPKPDSTNAAVDAEQNSTSEAETSDLAGNESPSGKSPNTPEQETTTDRQSLNLSNNETGKTPPATPGGESVDEKLAANQISGQAPGANSQKSQSPSKSPDSESDPTAPQPSAEQMANQPKPQDTRNSSKGSPQSKSPQPSESRQANQSGQEMAKSENGQSPPPSPGGSTPPPNGSSPLELDVPQPQESMSNRMRLKIDEWAGSFAGQERLQLEMSIAPQIQELDELLETAETLARNILDSLDAGGEWQASHGRDLDRAGQEIAQGLEIVEELKHRTHGTPYAFVGLQLANIGKVHVQPARRDFWKGLQTEGENRVGAIRDGWQHTTRAREMLAQLSERFEVTRQEFALADSIEQVKKMYQVFVENSMALLNNNAGESSPYSRKRVEFDLDEEYLARLKEVLEMRNNMRAELAKILAEDPRLLRRFLDSQQNRRNVLRYELEEMLESQRELNREVTAWSEADDETRPDLQALLLARHVEMSEDLAVDAAVLQDRFETWLPLAEESSSQEVQGAARLLQEIASVTEELSADAAKYVEQNQRAELKKSEEVSSEERAAEPTESVGEVGPSAAEISVEQIAEGAQTLHGQLTKLEVSLQQLGLQEDQPEMAVFAANRLLDTRNLIALSSEWLRGLKQHQAGKYQNAAEVQQYRLAMETDNLAGKLASVEQQMAGLLQRVDQKIPENIALKARELLSALDEQAAPNQLSAVYALRRNQFPRAIARQKSAVEAIEQAGKNYDELIQLAIKELDKLPVQDPIASLLDDPTLDELLASLEQELPLEELLGIPLRPSNLQIMGDFSRPGGDNALMTGGGGRQMLLNQLKQQQRLRQRRLERQYRKAVARALNETDIEDPSAGESLEIAQETVEWNVLLSQLGDDLQQGAEKAPPERYRRAIEQYFQQVSRPEKNSDGKN